MSTHHVFDRQPEESEPAFTAFRTYLNLGSQCSLAAVGRQLGKSKALIWSADPRAGVGWRECEAYTNQLFRQADLEQQRELSGKIVTRDETLEELSAICSSRSRSGAEAQLQ